MLVWKTKVTQYVFRNQRKWSETQEVKQAGEHTTNKFVAQVNGSNSTDK
jgi:hypothetical protein